MHPTRSLLRLFLKLNEISRLEDDRVWSQLRGRQAGGDGGTQEVHRRRGGQAEELALRRPGPCREDRLWLLGRQSTGSCLQLSFQAFRMKSVRENSGTQVQKTTNRKVWASLR